MAIAFDAQGTGFDFSATSVSGSITIGSLTNGILVIGVHWSDGGANTISSVTVDGSATGVIHLGDTISASTGSVTAIYYKLNPGSGSHTVVANFTGADFPALTLRSYSGVSQSTPFGTPAEASGQSTTPTLNVSTTSGDLVIDEVTWNTAGGSVSATVGAGQTQRVNTGPDPAEGGAGSEETASGGTTTMSWTLGSARDWSIFAAVMNAAAAGPSAGELAVASRAYGQMPVVPRNRMIASGMRVGGPKRETVR